jgi:hypothetical protein
MTVPGGVIPVTILAKSGDFRVAGVTGAMVYTLSHKPSTLKPTAGVDER